MKGRGKKGRRREEGRRKGEEKKGNGKRRENGRVGKEIKFVATFNTPSKKIH